MAKCRRKGIRWEYNGDGVYPRERLGRFWKRYWRRWERRGDKMEDTEIQGYEQTIPGLAEHLYQENYCPRGYDLWICGTCIKCLEFWLSLNLYKLPEGHGIVRLDGKYCHVIYSDDARIPVFNIFDDLEDCLRDIFPELSNIDFNKCVA